MHYFEGEKSLAPRPKLIFPIGHFFGFEFSGLQQLAVESLLYPLRSPIWLRVIGKLRLIRAIGAHNIKISLVIISQ